MCDYNPSVHFNKDAQHWHLQKCISKTMSKMSDPVKCTEYMSSVLSTSDNTKACSITNIKEICKKSNDNFTVKDAKQLCMMKNDATSRFWMSKKN